MIAFYRGQILKSNWYRSIPVLGLMASLSVRANVFVAERSEPPGEFPSHLRILTGQHALFRCKVSDIGYWLDTRLPHC
jgi:hypothetical protein